MMTVGAGLAQWQRRKSGTILIGGMTAVAVWVSCAIAAEPPNVTTAPLARNLVVNGGFELGDRCPSGWLIRFPRVDLSELTDIRALDNLTLFWHDTQSTRGKCIRMDTDVDQKEVHKRMEELIANPDAPPWPKTPTRPPKYDTAAGLEGVSLWSDPIPVVKGKMYRMSVDVMGQTEGMLFFPKLFVRGFGMAKDAKGKVVLRKLYDTYLACRVEGPRRWCRFSQTFSPTEHTPGVTEMRVVLFAYWPPGEYYWDNVEIVEVPEAEAAAIRAAKAQPPKPEILRPTPRTRKAGESFAIEEEEPMELPEKKPAK
ncbi:MAG: hypothetical protein N3D11_03675 [Candidatus Sumerlaeia bacterium]|nr:hypothetical protein [Candidatus Sumerlaeia bacterium]